MSYQLPPGHELLPSRVEAARGIEPTPSGAYPEHDAVFVTALAAPQHVPQSTPRRQSWWRRLFGWRNP